MTFYVVQTPHLGENSRASSLLLSSTAHLIHFDDRAVNFSCLNEMFASETYGTH